MKDKRILDFFLFDGEGGGEGSGATASSSGSEQEGQQRVEYGKPSTGNGQTSQVGSDRSGQAQDLDAEFAALVGKGGRFHEVYGQKVSSAIQDRFRNQADLQGQVNQISEDLSPLFMNYGLESGDFEGLKDAIARDDAFFKSGAEKAGLDVDQYKENLRLQAEAERGRRITEAYEQEQRQQQLIAQWQSDAAELQQAFPAFDLEQELRANEAFNELLSNGVDVRTAFLSTHIDDILNGANAYAQRTATQNVVNNIQRRAARPAEGALNHSPAIQRKADPSKLTNEDIDEINRRVEAGETIGF